MEGPEVMMAFVLTLSGNLNDISNPNCLAVMRIDLSPFAKSFVIGICQMRHGEMKCSNLCEVVGILNLVDPEYPKTVRLDINTFSRGWRWNALPAQHAQSRPHW